MSKNHTQKEIGEMTLYYALTISGLILPEEMGRMKLTDEQKEVFGYGR